MLIQLILAQKNTLRIENRRLRDNMDPFLIPTERFIERYRIPPSLTIQLIGEISPFISEDDCDNAIPLHLRVLATLSFYASGCYQRRVGMDAFCMLSQSMVSKCIKEISTVIVKDLAPIYIRFPETQEEVDLIKERFMNDYQLEGVLALVDGSQISLSAVSLDVRNSYINRKGTTSINTQGIVDSDMRFLSVNARYPGSTHDTFIWNNSNIFTLLEDNFNLVDQDANVYRNSFLIGDLGYPLQPWLMIPVRDFTENHVNENKYNKKIRKIRSKNERGFAVLKNRFRCLLGERKLRYNHEDAGNIIYACCTLHNFLIENSFDIDFEIPKPARSDRTDEEDDDEFPLQNDYLEEGQNVRNQLIADHFSA